jgi:hypothetical protein
VLTPFDQLDGYERRVKGGTQPAGGAGPSGRPPVDAAYEKVSRQMREIREARHTSRLMDPSDLPPRCGGSGAPPQNPELRESSALK